MLNAGNEADSTCKVSLLGRGENGNIPLPSQSQTFLDTVPIKLFSSKNVGNTSPRGLGEVLSDPLADFMSVSK